MSFYKTAQSLRQCFMWVVLLMLGMTLAACGDKEPEQRKAFMSFLQSSVIEKSGLTLAKLTPEQEKSFGDYAKHYAVMTDFSVAMSSTSVSFKKSMGVLATINSPGAMLEKRADVEKAKADIDAFNTVIATNLAKAEEARAALKQPDDLKAVYDQAFNKMVVKPAGITQKLCTSISMMMQHALAFADFLTQNNFKVNGMMIQPVNDPAVMSQLQEKSEAIKADGKEIMTLRQELVEMMSGK